MPSRSIVLVTGASKGIGAATAVAFARAGYDVCVNYHSDAKGASATVEQCEAEGAKAVAVEADISDRGAVKELFHICDELLGPIDCLVNNAGIIGGTSTLASLTEGALQATFATNLFGAIYCLQEAVARMASDRGGAGG